MKRILHSFTYQNVSLVVIVVPGVMIRLSHEVGWEVDNIPGVVKMRGKCQIMGCVLFDGAEVWENSTQKGFKVLRFQTRHFGTTL